MRLSDRLSQDFPEINFVAGKDFLWSPAKATVFYRADNSDASQWTLLHEASHGILRHLNYKSDFDLLRLEVEAWDYAVKLGRKYGVTVYEEYIQDCLDTYRDWLHKRSSCPVCGLCAFQKSISQYQCFNCSTIWNIARTRLCRPYRRLAV